MKTTIQQDRDHTTILVDKIPQSSFPPPPNDYWLQMIPDFPIETCLILGLGGGTIAKLLIDKFPDIKIIGVDNSQEIIDLGTKYMGLDKLNVKIIIDDAFNYVKEVNKKFDLVIVDLFSGHWFPVKVVSQPFLASCQQLLNENGLLYVNTPNIANMVSQLKVKHDTGTNIIYEFKNLQSVK